MPDNPTSIYILSPERESQIWKDCIFVFDSSVLLSFYSMPVQTRQKIYDSLILPNINRFWIPGHARFEYLKNREKVIVKPITENYELLEKETIQQIEILVNQLSSKTNDLGRRIKNQEYHPHFDSTEVNAFAVYLETLKTEHEKFKNGVSTRISAAKKEINSLKKADDFLDFFGNFCIGRDFSFSEIYQISLEGKHRYEFSIPPGYEDQKDKEKIGTQIFGDLIIWKQILEYSDEIKKPILFICNDLKADWCHTQTAGGDKRIAAPREELIKEIKDHSGSDFWMYNLPQFLYHANKQWAGTINKTDIDALAKVISESAQGKPALELELLSTGTMRRNSGYSDKNPVHTDESGKSYRLIGGQNKPIIHWDLTWEMRLRIHNQSSYPAFNIKMEQGNEKWFPTLEHLPLINSLKPLDVLSLDAAYYEYIESASNEADELLKQRIPQGLNGLVILLSYQNEQRKLFEKRYKIENGSMKEVL